MSEWPVALGQVKVQRTSPTFQPGWKNGTGPKPKCTATLPRGERRESSAHKPRAGGAQGGGWRGGEAPWKHREGLDSRRKRIGPQLRWLSKVPRRDRAVVT